MLRVAIAPALQCTGANQLDNLRKKMNQSCYSMVELGGVFVEELAQPERQVGCMYIQM